MSDELPRESSTPLTWTDERPTLQGWYLERNTNTWSPGMVWVDQELIDRNEFKAGSQWAGPIPEPAEPEMA
jgi:hypothetical protein